MAQSNSYKILVFGLPGSGKTTFANKLAKDAPYFNNDDVRRMFTDWYFSMHGRIRQAERMYCLANMTHDHAVVDFICPYDQHRHDYDVKVWMITSREGRYNDTYQMFEKPSHCTFEVKDYKYDHIIEEIKKKL